MITAKMLENQKHLLTWIAHLKPQPNVAKTWKSILSRKLFSSPGSFNTLPAMCNQLITLGFDAENTEALGHFDLLLQALQRPNVDPFYKTKLAENTYQTLSQIIHAFPTLELDTKKDLLSRYQHMDFVCPEGIYENLQRLHITMHAPTFIDICSSAKQSFFEMEAGRFFHTHYHPGGYFSPSRIDANKGSGHQVQVLLEEIEHDYGLSIAKHRVDKNHTLFRLSPKALTCWKEHIQKAFYETHEFLDHLASMLLSSWNCPLPTPNITLHCTQTNTSHDDNYAQQNSAHPCSLHLILSEAHLIVQYGAFQERLSLETFGLPNHTAIPNGLLNSDLFITHILNTLDIPPGFDHTLAQAQSAHYEKLFAIDNAAWVFYQSLLSHPGGLTQGIYARPKCNLAKRMVVTLILQSHCNTTSPYTEKIKEDFEKLKSFEQQCSPPNGDALKVFLDLVETYQLSSWGLSKLLSWNILHSQLDFLCSQQYIQTRPHFAHHLLIERLKLAITNANCLPAMSFQIDELFAKYLETLRVLDPSTATDQARTHLHHLILQCLPSPHPQLLTHFLNPKFSAFLDLPHLLQESFSLGLTSLCLALLHHDISPPPPHTVLTLACKSPHTELLNHFLRKNESSLKFFIPFWGSLSFQNAPLLNTIQLCLVEKKHAHLASLVHHIQHNHHSFTSSQIYPLLDRAARTGDLQGFEIVLTIPLSHLFNHTPFPNTIILHLIEHNAPLPLLGSTLKKHLTQSAPSTHPKVLEAFLSHALDKKQYAIAIWILNLGAYFDTSFAHIKPLIIGCAKNAEYQRLITYAHALNIGTQPSSKVEAQAIVHLLGKPLGELLVEKGKEADLLFYFEHCEAKASNKMLFLSAKKKNDICLNIVLTHMAPPPSQVDLRHAYLVTLTEFLEHDHNMTGKIQSLLKSGLDIHQQADSTPCSTVSLHAHHSLFSLTVSELHKQKGLKKELSIILSSIIQNNSTFSLPNPLNPKESIADLLHTYGFEEHLTHLLNPLYPIWHDLQRQHLHTSAALYFLYKENTALQAESKWLRWSIALPKVLLSPITQGIHAISRNVQAWEASTQTTKDRLEESLHLIAQQTPLPVTASSLTPAHLTPPPKYLPSPPSQDITNTAEKLRKLYPTPSPSPHSTP